jgi:mRNA deadenylase 3'-5' endonuclease subunit Ccr4
MSSVQLVDREVISVASALNKNSNSNNNNNSNNNGAAAAATTSKKFSVMQFNILADSLSDSFPKADKAILAWSYREPLIVTQITSRLPTVVCIEECDHFEDLETRLAAFGYKGFFVKKKSATSKDGCAMFYRTDAVECLYHRAVGLGGTQVALVAHFVLKEESSSSSISSYSTLEECKTSNTTSPRRFFVAMTHLKVGFEEQRLRQVETLMQIISQYTMAEDDPSMKVKSEDVSR